MHGPLDEHLHTEECNVIIRELQRCHQVPLKKRKSDMRKRSDLTNCTIKWHFQENSMFKQFFGACNQLDWSVLKIRNKCTNLFVGGSITYPKGTLANKFWYPLHFPWTCSTRAMRACTKNERLEREKEARQESKERITRVRNKWGEIFPVHCCGNLPSFLLLNYPLVRMANLKSDDWRENLRERQEKEKTEKEA